MKAMTTILMAAIMLLTGAATANAQNDVYDKDYYGLRIGPAFTSVAGDDPALNGSGLTTGLNVGVVYGKLLTDDAPVFLETGLHYIEKGGNGMRDNHDFKYHLNYLELPFVVKYVYSLDSDFTVQPYLGGYFALGISGKVKNYRDREAYSSFGSDVDQFQRFDGGLKIGCGCGYDMFYGEIGYEFGLSNICHSDFDESSNSALTITIGVNF